MEGRGQLQVLAALLWGRGPVTLSRRLGGPQRQFGCFGEKKNILPLPVCESRIV